MQLSRERTVFSCALCVLYTSLLHESIYNGHSFQIPFHILFQIYLFHGAELFHFVMLVVCRIGAAQPPVPRLSLSTKSFLTKARRQRLHRVVQPQRQHHRYANAFFNQPHQQRKHWKFEKVSDTAWFLAPSAYVVFTEDGDNLALQYWLKIRKRLLLLHQCLRIRTRKARWWW
jgi:hypothetical protein